MLKEGKQAGEKARNKKVLSLLQCGQSPEFLKEITKKKTNKSMRVKTEMICPSPGQNSREATSPWRGDG